MTTDAVTTDPTIDLGAGRRSGTATLAQARDDARGRADISVEAMPYLPPSSSPHVPAGVDPAALTWAETVAGPGYTHATVARGTRIRLEDVEGDACAHVVVYSALNTAERLNVADTQKIPWQAYLGAGHPLLSGDGRVLATIATDGAGGHHDAFCGVTTLAGNASRYGAGEAHSATAAGRELLRLAGTKEGLEPRDLPPSVSFFKGVRVAADGALEWTGAAGAGASVELIAEMPLTILIANAAHPLDPRDDYTVTPLRVHAWAAAASAPSDPWWSATPERTRAYLNTQQHLLVKGIR
ncbi:urea amidolyase associated protein UAAP1 [Demequina sp. NBRC 110057]|uniref:urea amidolyase associated protein UAAP1 n=1 Tax=Demequina sp. NBRC 110057 TaxID=1570346 RepID=UPI001F452A04|nr:urea amidolyase associated protein UAAP1 [Demequina sp. NBRC 110057]